MKNKLTRMAALLLCLVMLLPMLPVVSFAEANDVSYGTIPENNQNDPFAIFMGGVFQASRGSWKDTLTKVREILGANPGNEVQILLTKDHNVTQYSENYNWLCYMNGSVVLDLNEKTLIAQGSSLFEVGVDENYKGDFDTTVTVKNGTVLQGNGNICAAQTNSSYEKKLDITFENVTFAAHPEYFNGGKRTSLFYASKAAANRGAYDYSLTLNDCTIDLRGITTSYTVFSFKNDNELISADIRVNGGKIFADTWDNLTFLTKDINNDTFVFGKGSDGSYTTLTLPTSYEFKKEIGSVNDEGDGMLFGNGTTDGDLTTYELVKNARVTPYGIAGNWLNSDANGYSYLMFTEDGTYLAAQNQFKGVQERAYWYWTGIKENSAPDVERAYTNVGKTVYVYMRKDVDNSGWRYTSATVLGTLVVDLGGNTLYRNTDSVIEANNNAEETAKALADRTDKLLVDGDYAACPTTNIIFKNGTILAGKSTSNNGVVVGITNASAHNKTFNITFENLVFGVAEKYYVSEKGLNAIVANDGGGSGTGKLTVNLTLRDCAFKIINDGEMVVPTTSFKLFNTGKSIGSIVIEGGHLEGTMNKVTFANDMSSITFQKGSDSKYFYFDITAGSVPSGEFKTDRGNMPFVKKSGNVYTFAVKASELGNALVPYEIYDDTQTYPFMVYVEGKLISAATGWNKVQEAARDYLNSNKGATVYALMRRDMENANYFQSAGSIDGTLVLDLDGYTLCRRDNSFLELNANGLSAEQCAFDTNIVIKNGTFLAGKTTSGNGHIVAVQANGVNDKSYNVTFDNVTFGISKVNYNANNTTVGVVLRDSGAEEKNGVLATSTIDVDLLLKNCTFDFTDSDETVVPAKGTSVIHTYPSKEPNDINITIEGGTFKGTHKNVTLHTAGKVSTLTYAANEDGKYLEFDLTEGAPKSGAVTTDKGDGYFYAAGNGKYLLGVGRAKVTGAQLNVGADLSMLYYVRIHDTALSIEDLSMQFTVAGKSKTVTEYEIVNGEYVFTLSGIAPQQIGDAIDATVLCGEEVIASKLGYSVKDNLLSLNEKSAAALGISEEKLAAMKTLIADLLLYGKAAQDYTDYAPDAPILDGSEEIVGSTVTPDESDAMTLTDNVASKPYFKSATVNFNTVNEIRINIFVGHVDASLVTVKMDGEEYKLSDLKALGGGDYLVTIPEILATELDTVHTVTLVYDGVDGASLSYSASAYAYAMQESSKAEMKALALALYRYGASADAYAEIA